jgi:hypothetical protein
MRSGSVGHQGFGSEPPCAARQLPSSNVSPMRDPANELRDHSADVPDAEGRNWVAELAAAVGVENPSSEREQAAMAPPEATSPESAAPPAASAIPDEAPMATRPAGSVETLLLEQVLLEIGALRGAQPSTRVTQQVTDAQVAAARDLSFLKADVRLLLATYTRDRAAVTELTERVRSLVDEVEALHRALIGSDADRQEVTRAAPEKSLGSC